MEENNGNMSDVLIAFLICSLIFVAMLATIFFYKPSDDNSQIFIALSVFLGGAVGWGTGIMLSPYTRSEDTSFKGIGKATSAFVGGYLIGKLDPAIVTFVESLARGTVPQLAQACALVGTTCFFVASSATYVSRKYWL